MRVMNKDQFISYFLGFVDGEGCFNISLKKQDSAKMRWVLDPVFHVTQHKNQRELLYNFQRMMGCGNVIKKYGQPDTLMFLVHSRKDLVDKIIPFFPHLTDPWFNLFVVIILLHIYVLGADIWRFN